MTKTGEVSIALMIRDYVAASGVNAHLMRNLHRYLRSQGLHDMTDARFYDAIKEMSDAGWIAEINYIGNYIIFDDRIGEV